MESILPRLWRADFWRVMKLSNVLSPKRSRVCDDAVALIGGTWAIVKLTTENLLYQDAYCTAPQLGRGTLRRTLPIEQIAGGELTLQREHGLFEASR